MIRQFCYSLLALTVVIVSLVAACAPSLRPTPAPTLTPEPTLPNLTMSAEIRNTGWTRGNGDLPACECYIEVRVTNLGGDAGLVNLTANYPSPGVILTSLTLYAGASYSYTHKFSIPLGISSEGWITYSANSAKADATCPLFMPANALPRSGVRPEVAKLYITPSSSIARELLRRILANKSILRTDFGAIQEWVDFNVVYKSDYSVHGESNYWQLPFETAGLRSGDCEDYAILLCTLLRAYGIPAEEVFVAIGLNADGTVAHAYLLEHWYYDEWRVIEPQSSFPLLTDIESWLTDLEYEDVRYFNDRYYFQVK